MKISYAIFSRDLCPGSMWHQKGMALASPDFVLDHGRVSQGPHIFGKEFSGIGRRHATLNT